jgi:5-methylcytosine-specific restriction endonuclease McrBC regulatory subunit McrC
VTTPAPILLTERSTTPIEGKLFSALQKSATVLELIEAGTITLVQSKRAPFGIRAAAHVGQALLEDGRSLVVAEKVPGALRNLLAWALPDDIRHVIARSIVARDSPVLSIFVSHFLDELGEYLRLGRLRQYVRVADAGSTVRGRIDPRASLALRLRGHPARLAYLRSELTADLLPNQLLALGLAAVETYCAINFGLEAYQTLARRYAPLFGDVDWSRYYSFGFELKTRMFDDALADERLDQHLRSALSYARALVLYLGAWSDPGVALPRAYFINLETLFQEAVRQVLQAVLVANVTKGSSLGRRLFKFGVDQYVVDPDIVVGDNPPALVADCKYKDLESEQTGPALPGHSDVYQLVAHTAALGASSGLLIYPGKELAIRSLGVTEGGIAVHFATIRLERLASDLAEMASNFKTDLTEAA